jgi:hypothetical protein
MWVKRLHKFYNFNLQHYIPEKGSRRPKPGLVLVFLLSVNTSVCDGGQKQKAPWRGTPPLTLWPAKSAVYSLTCSFNIFASSN